MLDATRWITAHCKQFFTKDANVVSRVFYGSNSGRLKVYGGDNCPGIASSVGVIVKLDSNFDGLYATTIAGADFELHPLNALLGPEPEPFKEIVLPFWTNATYRYFPAPIREAYRVQVTAKFGWPAVPANIRDGCIELAAIDLGVSTEDRDAIVRDKIDIYREAVFA